MPKLNNARWERFAQLKVLGKSNKDAYQGAGYKSEKHAGQYGADLARKPEMQARILEIEQGLNDETLANVALDRARVLKELEANARRAEEAGQSGAVNRSWELVGKELGMFADRIVFEDLDHMLEGMSEEQLRQYVKAQATQVGLRVVDDDEETARAWIFRNAERLGIRAVDCREDSDGAEATKNLDLQAEPEAGDIPPTRRH
jgi:hypothetical protein